MECKLSPFCSDTHTYLLFRWWIKNSIAPPKSRVGSSSFTNVRLASRTVSRLDYSKSLKLTHISFAENADDMKQGLMTAFKDCGMCICLGRDLWLTHLLLTGISCPDSNPLVRYENGQGNIAAVSLYFPLI